MIIGYADDARTENIQEEINKKILLPHFQLAKTKDGAEGIVILGGGARKSEKNPEGFGDRYCDVDMSIFVNNKEPWLPMFEYYIPDNLGLGIETGWFEMNTHQMLFEREEDASSWSDEQKKQAYEEAIIFYDKNGKTKDIIERRCKFDKVKAEKRIAELLQAYDSFTATKNPKKDHLSLNKILNQVVELAFLSNNEPRPHKKWRFEVVKRLPNIPDNFTSLLKEAILVKEITNEDIERRLKSINSIVNFYRRPYSKKENRITLTTYSKEDIQNMLCLITGQLYWLVDRNPKRQMCRGFALNAHDLINEGLNMAIETLRIINSQPVRQEIQALGVMSSPPEYDESEYNLWPENTEYENIITEALIIKDLTDKKIMARVKTLQKLTHDLKNKLEASGLVPSDPYHHALKKGIYLDRQLLELTFGEKVCPENIPEEKKKLFKGFTSYHLVGSAEDMKKALDSPIPGIYTDEQIQEIRMIWESTK